MSKALELLNFDVRRFQSRLLYDDYLYLIFDGVYIWMKSPSTSKRRCVLIVYGIRLDGTRELVSFHLAKHGESQAAWETFLTSLWYRGLKGTSLQLIVIDGNKGLTNAAESIYPMAKIQRCWTGTRRNAVQHVAKKQRASFFLDIRTIYNAGSRFEAVQAFEDFKKTWSPTAPKAVHCIQDNLETLLNFFYCPEELWKNLRTANVVECVFRAVRRRIRFMPPFQNLNSLKRVLVAVFDRQNKVYAKNPLWETP